MLMPHHSLPHPPKHRKHPRNHRSTPPPALPVKDRPPCPPPISTLSFLNPRKDHGPSTGKVPPSGGQVSHRAFHQQRRLRLHVRGRARWVGGPRSDQGVSVKDFCNRDEQTCHVTVGTLSKKGLERAI